MENFNAETVKSELEGLAKFRTCPEYIKNALALINSQEQRIKELTEKNERLQKALRTDISIVRVSRGNGKTAHLREVARVRMDAIRADTVRKMQSETKERCIKGGIYPAFVARTIDQIAEEIINEKI